MMPPEKKNHMTIKKMQIPRIKRKNMRKSRKRRNMKRMNTDNHHHMKICIVDT